MTVNTKIKPNAEIKTNEFSRALCQIGQFLTNKKKAFKNKEHIGKAQNKKKNGT